MGYQPLEAIDWQRAMCLLFLEKAESIVDYEGVFIHSASDAFALPAVLRLKDYNKPAPSHTKFCRENVFLRDSHSCQYCGKLGAPRNLTFDHVQPRSKGGKTTWLNIVTSCRPCNHSKADRTLRQAGMKLLSEPHVPSRQKVQRALFSKNGVLPIEWEDWIQ